MITRLLDATARLGLHRPGLVAATMLVPALVSVYALQVPVDLSFAAVMDREQPEVARYFAASQRFRLGGRLPLLVEGPEESLDEAMLALRLGLDDLETVRSVSTGPPREWLLARLPFFVEAETFERWLALAERSLAGQDASERGLSQLGSELQALQRRHLPRSPEGSRLVVVSLASDPFELALDSEVFPEIRETTRGALAPFGARGRFAGMPAIIAQEQEATLTRMRVLGPLSLVSVLMLFCLIERRPLAIASLALPMLLSVGMTMGVIGAIAGDLTLMESVFGVIVFGLGIDFSIHLILRMREERSHGRDFAASLRRALSGTGRGIVAGGTTTGGAFLALLLSPDPVFYRLGLAGGLGLLLCFIFLVLFLPAEWSLIERWSPQAPAVPRRFVVPGVGRLAGEAARHPAVSLLSAMLALALCAPGIARIEYETNLEEVFSREIDAVDTARLLHERFGVDPGPWLVAAVDIEEARTLSAAFEADPLFARTESLAFLFPPDLGERHARLDAIAPALARRVRTLEEEARQPEAAGGDLESEHRELLTALLRAQAFGPPELDALPATLSERLRGPDGELIVRAFVAEPALDSAVAARERRAAQAIHPEATSINVIYEALIGTERPWAPAVVSVVAVFILVVLYVDLRSKRLVLLTLIPVVTAGLFTIGLLGQAGFEFNTVTLIAVPLLLGLGIDDGIHIVHRMLEQPERPLCAVVASVGSAVVMTTVTTCASVATLLLTRHPGIESMAILLLVGLPLCLLASVTLLPASAVLLGAPTLAELRAARVD